MKKLLLLVAIVGLSSCRGEQKHEEPTLPESRSYLVYHDNDVYGPYDGFVDTPSRYMELREPYKFYEIIKNNEVLMLEIMTDKGDVVIEYNRK